MKCVRRYDSSCIVVVVPAGNDLLFLLGLMIYEVRQVLLHCVHGLAVSLW